jgi:hypothetical protein
MRVLLFAEQRCPIKEEKKRQDAVVPCKNHESISRVDLNFSTSDNPPSREVLKGRQ